MPPGANRSDSPNALKCCVCWPGGRPPSSTICIAGCGRPANCCWSAARARAGPCLANWKRCSRPVSAPAPSPGSYWHSAEGPPSRSVRFWDSSGDPDTNPNYGTISRAGLISVIGDSRWGMTASAMPGGELTTVLLNQKMGLGPVILGYYEPAVSGNHVVVAYGASETHVAAMNPDGARFVGLPVGHYSQSSEVILGIPTR